MQSLYHFGCGVPVSGSSQIHQSNGTGSSSLCMQLIRRTRFCSGCSSVGSVGGVMVVAVVVCYLIAIATKAPEAFKGEGFQGYVQLHVAGMKMLHPLTVRSACEQSVHLEF